MKLTILPTSTSDLIYILDDVFEAYEQAHLRMWLEKAAYVFSIPGMDMLEDRQQRALSCFLTDEQIESLGMFERDNFKDATKVLEGRKRIRVWANLTTYMTDCHYHVDWYDSRGALTCIYYANTVWEKNWGGETIICNRDDEVELAVEAKPNRILIFPSRLNHRVANLSRHAPPHRFVIVSLWGEAAA